MNFGIVRRLKMPWRKSLNTTASTGLARRMRQLLQNVVGNRPVIQSIELEETIAASNDRILVDGRSGWIDDGATFDAGLLQVAQHEVLDCVVTQDG